MTFTLYSSDLSESLSSRDHKKKHHDTKKVTHYERSPMPHLIQSSTDFSKALKQHGDFLEKKKFPRGYKDPISLGLGAFYYIPPLHDEKPIVRSLWPTQLRQACVIDKKDGKISSPVDIVKQYRWTSVTKRSQKGNQLLQCNHHLEPNLGNITNSGKITYAPRSHSEKAEDWDRRATLWSNMKLEPAKDMWVEDIFGPNPIDRFVNRKPFLWKQREKALEATTKNSIGNKVNYQCRSNNMPDWQGNIKISQKELDYSRALEDEHMHFQNRTYRTFPIDMVKDRNFMRSQIIEPTSRITKIVYPSNPFKRVERKALTQLNRLKYP